MPAFEGEFGEYPWLERLSFWKTAMKRFSDLKFACKKLKGDIKEKAKALETLISEFL